MNPITFPNLNLELNISPIAFHICGRPIYWYGLIILFGIVLALFLMYKKIKNFSKEEQQRKGFNWETISDLVIIMIPIGIICARLYYCIFNGDYYFKNPGEIIKVWNRWSCHLWRNYWGNFIWFCFLQGKKTKLYGIGRFLYSICCTLPISR